MIQYLFSPLLKRGYCKKQLKTFFKLENMFLSPVVLLIQTAKRFKSE